MEYQQERSLYAQRVDRGEDNIRYLKAHTNFLTHREKKVLATINSKTLWSWSTHLWWLDEKRRLIDGIYDEERKLEIKEATKSNQDRKKQLDEGIKRHNHVEYTGLTPPTEEQAADAIIYLKRKGKL
jgi:hypothetical protein